MKFKSKKERAIHIKDLLKAGGQPKEIATNLGVTLDTVYKIKHRPIEGAVILSQQNYRKKTGNISGWTDEDVRGVRNAYENDFTVCEIAKEFGMKYSVVYDMVNKITFKYI